MKQKNMTVWLLAAIISCQFSVASAQMLLVSGPAESLAGDLVVLQASDSGLQASGKDTEAKPEARSPKSEVPPEVRSLKPEAYAWSVTPPETVEGKFRVCDGGRTMVFASRLPGTYFFTVAAVIDGKPVVVTHRLDNVSPIAPIPLPPSPPEPPAPPEPPPPPPPDIDAAMAALRQLAEIKAIELVKSQYFDREKKALAESFLATNKWRTDNVNCILANGKPCVTPETLRAKQRENARKYLSTVSRNSWQTWEAWSNEMAKYLAELDAAQTLTVEQIGQAYKMIGIGLTQK